MLDYYRKSIFILFFNILLFIFLVIGIQNSNQKFKLNLIVNETIELPFSFILGSSFIGGSLSVCFLEVILSRNK